MPERIQLSRKKGWRIPPNTLIVSRPHWLGNPFKIYQHCKGNDGDWGVVDAGRLDTPLGNGWTREGAARFAVDCYQQVLDEHYPAGSSARFGLVQMLREYDHLGCWCPAGQPCHADVLLEIANQ